MDQVNAHRAFEYRALNFTPNDRANLFVEQPTQIRRRGTQAPTVAGH
jgi:hypothetical protein